MDHNEKRTPSGEHDEERVFQAAQKGDKAELPEFTPPTPAEEAAVIRKLDFRLIPLVFLLYMLSVLDRSNLGNARLAGLEVRCSDAHGVDLLSAVCLPCNKCLY